MHITALITRPTLSKISSICAFAHDQRRRQRDGFAGDADQDAFVAEGAVHRLVGALARRARPRGEIDAGGKPTVRISSTPGSILERHRGIGKTRLQRLGAREQVFVAIKIERRETRGAGQRMRRIGVAVEQFDDMLGAAHERVIDAVARDDAAHRHRARGDAFGEADHVRRHAIALGGEGVAEPAEAGDHLVEDQQNAVAVADRAQLLQIALAAAAARRSSPPSARR